MKNIRIHKVLMNGPKNKTIPSFDRENHVESKYVIRNEFDFVNIPKKGVKPKM